MARRERGTGRAQLSRWPFLASFVLGTIAVVASARSLAWASSLEQAAGDTIHARCVVPDNLRKVGEVRLVTRGNAVVVQTLLSTKVLSRVLAEIAKKEQRN